MRQAIATPSAQAEIRQWPLDASIAALVLLDVAMVPTAEQIETWLRDAYATSSDGSSQPRRVRTSALYPGAAAAFTECGFEAVDRLALLERPLIGPTSPGSGRPPDQVQLRRVRRRDLDLIAELDQASFPIGWRNDATSLANITSATPLARRRLAVTSPVRNRRALGFAITGLAGTTAYLQRLAVHPDARRVGVGHVLVDDALGWAMRRGARRALVNTAVDNVAALALYERAAFALLDQELVVLEHRREP